MPINSFENYPMSWKPSIDKTQRPIYQALAAFPIWEAVRKMTVAPAGLLRKGYRADIVVFDPNTIADRATYDNPLQQPVGIRHVLVNGQIAVSHGQLTHAASGIVIRN